MIQNNISQLQTQEAVCDLMLSKRLIKIVLKKKELKLYDSIYTKWRQMKNSETKSTSVTVRNLGKAVGSGCGQYPGIR